MADFQFTPATGYEDAAVFPTKPTSEIAFRASMMTLLYQLRDYINAAPVGDLSGLDTTDKASVVAAINEVLGNVGSLSTLTTSSKASAVAAINEVLGKVGNLASLATADKTSLVNAINEIVNNDTAPVLLDYTVQYRPYAFETAQENHNAAYVVVMKLSPWFSNPNYSFISTVIPSEQQRLEKRRVKTVATVITADLDASGKAGSTLTYDMRYSIDGVEVSLGTKNIPCVEAFDQFSTYTWNLPVLDVSCRNFELIIYAKITGSISGTYDMFQVENFGINNPISVYFEFET